MEVETRDKVKVLLRREERENLIARATHILNEENDDEVLESVVELLEDLKINAGMRKELKHFQTNGWAVFRRTRKRNDDIKFHDSPIKLDEQAKETRNLPSRLDHENHPMNNELVLKTIFGLLSVYDLKMCRRVSKKWRDLSLCSWRQKAVLITMRLFPPFFVYEDDDEAAASKSEFIKNASKVLESSLQRYNMNFDEDSGYPKDFRIKKRKIMLEFFSSSIQDLFVTCDNLDIMCFLLTKLPDLHVLHLELDCETLYPEYQSIITKGQDCPLQNLKPVLLKLKKFELNINHFYNPNSRNMTVSFPWKKIFESVPALRSFELKFRGRYSNTVSEEIMHALCEVRRQSNSSTLNLEELRTHPGSSARWVEGSNFPLQTLCIDLVDDDNNNPSTISTLLEAHAETLKYLNGSIYIRSDQLHEPSEPLTSYLPSKVNLPKLKELMLTHDWVWAFHLLSSLEAPNIEKLEISIGNCGLDIDEGHRDILGLILSGDAFIGSCFFPNLTEFICDASVMFRLTELQMLGKSMPNLKDLHMRLGEDTFPTVFKLWPDLESLHVRASGETFHLIDDYAITGFLVQGLDDPVQVRKESCEPNITDLKNLRKFVLETGSGGRGSVVWNVLRPRRACISDISAVFGFLKLPKLETLHIQTFYKFSPRIMAALENHVSEVKISEPYIFKGHF